MLSISLPCPCQAAVGLRQKAFRCRIQSKHGDSCTESAIPSWKLTLVTRRRYEESDPEAAKTLGLYQRQRTFRWCAKVRDAHTRTAGGQPRTQEWTASQTSFAWYAHVHDGPEPCFD